MIDVTPYLPTVRKLARIVRRRHTGASLDDLEGDGMVGLVQASHSYDPAQGAAFLTHAYPRVRGAMIDGMRRMSLVKRRSYEWGEIAEMVEYDAGTMGHSEDPTRAILVYQLGKMCPTRRDRQAFAAMLTEQTHPEIAAAQGISASLSGVRRVLLVKYLRERTGGSR